MKLLLESISFPHTFLRRFSFRLLCFYVHLHATQTFPPSWSIRQLRHYERWIRKEMIFVISHFVPLTFRRTFCRFIYSWKKVSRALEYAHIHAASWNWNLPLLSNSGGVLLRNGLLDHDVTGSENRWILFLLFAFSMRINNRNGNFSLAHSSHPLSWARWKRGKGLRW